MATAANASSSNNTNGGGSGILHNYRQQQQRRGGGGAVGSTSSRLAGYFFTVVLAFGALMTAFSGRVILVGNNINGDASRSRASSSSYLYNELSMFSAGGTTTAKSSTTKKKMRYNREYGDEGYSLAGLNCDRYGGPSEDVAKEMVYWKDIPADSRHVSPFRKKSGDDGDAAVGYLTFESDHGGWNNIRMALETVVAIAFAMGRTLVLPPEERMYLLNQGTGKEGERQRKQFSYNHFFHLEAVHNE